MPSLSYLETAKVQVFRICICTIVQEKLNTSTGIYTVALPSLMEKALQVEDVGSEVKVGGAGI